MAGAGLEVDHTRTGLLPVGFSHDDLEVTPTELHREIGPAPQPYFNVEKGVDANFKPNGYNEFPSNRFTRSFIRRRGKLVALLTAIGLVVIIIVLATTLSQRKTSTAPASGLTVSGSQPFSTFGAFNGSGLTTFNVDANQIPITYLFYQDFKGQIRMLQKFNSQWSDGSSSPVVMAHIAKNATPLACVNYTNPTTNIATAHLFYADWENILQEVISTDALTTWHIGPLGNLGIEISALSVALAAIYSDVWFGTIMGNSSGIRLYYGATDNQVHELAYALSSQLWSPQSVLNGTIGNAGIAASTVNEDSGTAYIYTLDTANKISLWTLNSTVKSNSAATTYGNLTKESLFPPVAIAANSSLGYAQGWVAFQESSRAISAVQTFPSGPDGAPWGSTMSVGGPTAEYAQVGSSIATASVYLGPDAQWSNSLDFFYQPNGSAVTECINEGFTYDVTQLPV